MAERRFFGQAAAPGLAEGRLVRLSANHAAARAGHGGPIEEAALLDRAIEAARDALLALAAGADPDAAEMLGFQVALLEDPALAEPAHASIQGGQPADAAWAAVLDAEIAGYEAAEDEYFRARASDLADLRDQVLARITGVPETVLPNGAIVVADDLPPSRFLAMQWQEGGGIALARGSPSSHVAMLARARSVPMVVGIGPVPAALADGTVAMVDGEGGTLVLDPAEATRALLRRAAHAVQARAASAEPFRLRPATTADGTPVRVLLNVGDPAELDALDPAMCDGIGLTRTEFLFSGTGPLPDEPTQLEAYARILRWADGRPVVLRTLDAGGDKPIGGLTIDGESNPFLGVRGIRLSLARPEVFRVQLRAIARAAALGPVSLMLPMVAVPAELAAAHALLEQELEALREAGIACARPPLGIMVEVPAAALCAERFAAEFYSIGSNDLTQYTMAAARDIGAVAALNDPADAAVMALVACTVEAAAARGVEVSLCGDAAGEPRMTELLLRAGLRSLSMAPGSVAAVKQAIAHIDLGRPR